ncbi:MAG: penicillin-binding protein activator, partial [Betaproteobacteria bacterium]
MQRILAFLITLLALSSGVPVHAANPAPVIDISLPLQDAPAKAVPPPAAEALPNGDHAHIALLLPLDSDSFGQAAEAVRQGAVAASAMQAAPQGPKPAGQMPATLPLQTYPTGDRMEDIVSAYRQALQAGAKIVVGPLTRHGVTALARSGLISVPTRALNA